MALPTPGVTVKVAPGFAAKNEGAI